MSFIVHKMSKKLVLYSIIWGITTYLLSQYFALTVPESAVLDLNFKIGLSQYFQNEPGQIKLSANGGGKNPMGASVGHVFPWALHENESRVNLSLANKSEFLRKLKEFSNTYKEGLPEERKGIAYFKGKAKCITCHNSLYLNRTNDYLSKLMEFNHTGSEIKIDVKKPEMFKEIKHGFSDSDKNINEIPGIYNNESGELIDYLKDESDIKWQRMTVIPSA